MVTAVKEKAGSHKALDGDLLLRAYRVMLLARATEDKLASLYRAGMIKGGVFLGKGQEALSTASSIFLKKGDLFGPLIRDQAGRLAFGDTVLDTLRTYLGSAKGPMRGRDGNIHRGRPKEGYYAMISHLGAMVPVVAGGLYARRLRGETGVVGVTSIGDG
ncbi:MAG: thiamine pyrophosphate-dependent enzyme, partial [Chthoniobacterales bacterium]